MSTTSITSDIYNRYGTNEITDETSRASGSDMSKDTFMNLLATQMKYQDPLEPQSNEEMLAQMAQFSALEQMQNLYKTSAIQQAYSLIGKNIVGLNGDNKVVSGTVESVGFKNGEAYLYVNGNDVTLDKVKAVGSSEPTVAESELAETFKKINETLEEINEKLDNL